MSGWESDSSLPDTQTPNTCLVVGSQELNYSKQAWGRLEPMLVYLNVVDLIKPQFLLGRTEDCDVVLSMKNFEPNRLKTVSKIHFQINYDEDSDCAFVMDLSKNGTYINQKVIGKDQQVRLENNDKIAIGTKTSCVYVYKKVGTDSFYLPKALRNKYQISRKLGEGGCGEVRLLYRKDNFKEYAVKKIVKSNIKMKTNLNSEVRIHTEIAILQSLSHPHIISMEEITETNEAVFMVLEYMRGGSLLEYMEALDKPLHESKVKSIFYQIVIGVQYLHSQGITHRDLKPGNILLNTTDSEMLVKISDFGLSKIISNNNTSMCTVCGTPYFVAPEVIDLNCTSYTKEVDVWSLGVLLYYMLSKELPFTANSGNYEDVYRFILEGNYSMEGSMWSAISNNAKHLITRMLVRNPKERFTINDIVGHSWITSDQEMLQTIQHLVTDQSGNCDSSEDLGSAAKKRRLI